MPDLLTQLTVIMLGVMIVFTIIALLVAIPMAVVVTLGTTGLFAYVVITFIRDEVRVVKAKREARQREEERWKHEREARVAHLQDAAAKKAV